MLKTWEAFRRWFEANYLEPRKEINKETARAVERSLRHFERLCQPGQLATIDAKAFDHFIAKRRDEQVSDGTIGKDLDHVRLALNFAVENRALTSCPTVPRLDDEKRPVRFVEPDHFAAIFQAAGSDWWRAFLATAVSSGFYVKELLELQWPEVDLDAGLVALKAGLGNRRRRRPKKARLHPLAVKLLRRLSKAGAGPEVFAWPKRPQRGRRERVAEDRDALERWSEGDRWRLWKGFRDIQEQAGVKLVCNRDHRHTELCEHYGFDDLRVAATLHRGDELLDRIKGVSAAGRGASAR